MPLLSPCSRDPCSAAALGAAPGGGLLALPLGDDDFGLVESQGAYSRYPGRASALFADDGAGLPTEMTEEETFDLPGMSKATGACGAPREARARR